MKAKARRVATSTSTRRPLVALGFAALLCCLALAAAGGAQASKSVYFFFGSGGTLGGQFNTTITLGGPGGVAVNQNGTGDANPGDLYVADRFNNRIERFSSTGTFISAWGFDVIQADKPGDLGTSVFEVCTVAADCKAGITSVVPQPGGELSQPQGLAVDQGSGNLYVTNQAFRRVEVFTATGSFVRAFGKDVIQTGKPGDLGVNVFEVCTAAADCQIGSATTPTSGGEFANAFNGHLAVAPAGAPNAGNVLVPDPANRRIQEFTPTGSFVRLFGWDVIPTGKPGDLGANVFEVCTSTVTGDCQAGQTTAPGNNPGQFATNTPTRLAIDSTGSIYAVEPTTNFRVQKFTLPSNVLTPQGAFAPAELSGTSSSGATQNNSTDVAVGPGDHVFVVKVFPTGTGAPPAAAQERRVLELDSTGTLLDTHMAGAAINSVNGLGLNTANGRLFVPSGTNTNQRVYVLADPPDSPPVVTSGEAGPGADFSLRTLEGTVNPEEFKVSDCHFEYGKTSEYGIRTACVPGANDLGEGTVPVAVSASTEPLAPNTTYHYRLFASNSALASEGEDRTFTTGPTPADNCANAERRAEQGIEAILLPDCMALEMVSPPKKDGQLAQEPALSASGERVLFKSTAALAGTPGVLSLLGDPYIASRGPSGWSTDHTTQPGIYRGWYTGAEALSFTPDLSEWLTIGGTATQFYLGAGQVFRGSLGGTHSALSPLFEPVGGGEQRDLSDVELRGASEDHSHLYFTPGPLGDTSSAYLPGDPGPSGTGAEHNTYLAKLDAKGEPSLELMARDRLGKAWGGNCGAHVGGVRNQGAISADGSRTYFTTRPGQPATEPCEGTANKLRILQRLESEQGPWIGEAISPECNRIEPEPCNPLDGDDVYQGASIDQSRLYLTTTRQLADSDLDTTADLYLHDASLPPGSRLIQVSAGEVAPGHPTVGAGAEAIEGTTKVSGDGSHAYFAAKGALTNDTSPRGLAPVAGQLNYYAWDRDSETLGFVGTLDAADSAAGAAAGAGGAYPVPLTGEDLAGEQIGGEGGVLLLLSKAPLSADDTDGAFRDAFRYDAASETIELISKPAAGAVGSASFDVAPRLGLAEIGTDFAEQVRWVSEDGQTVVLKTAEGLLPGDVNTTTDSYLWREGQATRLPGTTAANQNDQPVLSHDGSTVAFPSFKQLLPADGDAAKDIYAVRVEGGFEPPAAPPVCDALAEGACQGPVSGPPSAPASASEATFPGNPPPVVQPRRCPKGKRQVRRGQRVRCVARKNRRKASRQQRSRHANTDRRAGK